MSYLIPNPSKPHAAAEAIQMLSPAAVSHAARNHLLSADDIKTMNTQRAGLAAAVLTKIEDFRKYAMSPHVIEPTKYKTVYATSDIHADLRKFNYLMKGAGLVDQAAPENSVSEIAAQMHDTGSVTWTGGAGTLVVIVGDFVDGKRAEGMEVEDTVGNVELLLHAYVYNLRIKARLAGSEIRFLVGNHDLATVIDADKTGFYDNYVHAKAKSFFGQHANRRISLLPFYNCCPYVFISIGKEIAFVHGGLHRNDTAAGRDLAALVALQTDIDKDGLIEALSVRSPGSTQKRLKAYGEEGPLWARYYSDKSKATVCKSISEGEYNMTVVGHCPTGSGFTHHKEILQGRDYGDQCKNGGCVMLSCMGSKEGVPRPALAFVDIMMSRAFTNQPWEKEKARRAEFLKIDLNARGKIVNVERVQTNAGRGRTIPVWKGGGRRQRSRRSKGRTRRASTRRRASI